MKMPRYIKVEPVRDKLAFKITIKRWGLPILIYKCMKERFEFPWYYWLLYPYVCLKALFAWKGEAIE